MSIPNSETAKWPELTFLVIVYALYILAVTAPLGFIISAYKVYRFKRLTEKRTETPTHEALLIATHYEALHAYAPPEQDHILFLVCCIRFIHVFLMLCSRV